MAFGENEDQSQNTRITLMNMKTGNSYDITAGDGECLICYGFKDSDMVYGVSDIADAGVDADLRRSTVRNREIIFLQRDCI